MMANEMTMEMQLAQERRDFGWALQQIRHGDRARRSAWGDGGGWIALRVPFGAGHVNVRFIFFVDPCGDIEPWMPRHQDLLGEDWEIEP